MTQAHKYLQETYMYNRRRWEGGGERGGGERGEGGGGRGEGRGRGRVQLSLHSY